ncbi:MAG: DUF4838 domain-containing protein, partial [Planctomycetes bacterium]|nr:DUF4838 domain-containing protein [Planctomycetota bacterium]
VIYGVASLLERGLGIRWLAPGELWTVVPKRRHVAIPLGTYRETPAFAKRVIHITGVHEHDGVKYPHWHFGSADWAMRNRLNRKFEHVGRTQLRDVMAERGLTPLRGGHAMAFWMPNEPFFAAHPEYYRFDGERRKPLRGGGTQLNYSSVETSALIAQRVLDFLERDPVAETVGVDLNDGYGFSLDRQSRQEWFYDERGMPIVSDSVFGFTNRVAEIVSRRFPDVAIGQLAYTRYYHQPPRFPLHPNVGIRFTLYRGSQTHPMCEARNESDAQMRRELQEWRKLTDKLLIYEYLTGYWGQMMFASGVRMIADDIRWYRKMGFEGAMTEYEPGKPAREMLYVYARLLWNPQQDHADIIRDFHGAAYGKGSEKMLTAYEAYRQANERCGYEGSGAYLAAALTQVEGFRERMARLMQEAEGLAEEAAEKARIQRVRNEFAQFMKQGEPLAGCKLSFDEKPSPEQLLSSANVAPNPSF